MLSSLPVCWPARSFLFIPKDKWALAIPLLSQVCLSFIWTQTSIHFGSWSSFFYTQLTNRGQYSYNPNTQRCHPLDFLRPPTFQEEDSPDRGELRRVESSPTPLKRDRSFSEHDLALLRGGTSPSLAGSVQQDGTFQLRDERPRSRTLTGSRPVPGYRGQYLNVDLNNEGMRAMRWWLKKTDTKIVETLWLNKYCS